MAVKKPKLILQIIAVLFLLSFVTACNNDSEKKETTDSSMMKSDSMSTVPMMDTTKMDTASTREPVKPGD